MRGASVELVREWSRFTPHSGALSTLTSVLSQPLSDVAMTSLYHEYSITLLEKPIAGQSEPLQWPLSNQCMLTYRSIRKKDAKIRPAVVCRYLLWMQYMFVPKYHEI